MSQTDASPCHGISLGFEIQLVFVVKVISLGTQHAVSLGGGLPFENV
jgi:hypothetical protein